MRIPKEKETKLQTKERIKQSIIESLKIRHRSTHSAKIANTSDTQIANILSENAGANAYQTKGMVAPEQIMAQKTIVRIEILCPIRRDAIYRTKPSSEIVSSNDCRKSSKYCI